MSELPLLPPVGDKLWITVDYGRKTVDNRDAYKSRKGWVVMVNGYTHTFPPFFHTLYKGNPRPEQALYRLPTDNGFSYYDYLYIHTSSYANNLSTQVRNYLNYKSRG